MTHYATSKLPEGYAVGQRVKTNKLYAKIHPKAKGLPRRGVIVGASRGTEGGVVVKLDGMVHARPIHSKLFEVVSGT